jgi:hypothetical protein
MDSKGSLSDSQELSNGPYPEQHQSSSHNPNLFLTRSILMLPTHLCLGLLSGLFPFGFLMNNLLTFLFSPIHATCPAHLIFLNFITLCILGEEYKSCSFLLCSLLHLPVMSFLFGPNILLKQPQSIFLL